MSPWQPTDREVEPQVKVAAARAVEAAGALPAAPGVPAVAEVLYPQYGGLTRDAASVMVVVRQTWAARGRLRGRTVTADVRLSRTGRRWTVADLRPVVPVDRQSMKLAGPAASLARSPRVFLPDAAVADLAQGWVRPPVVEALLELSASYEFSVSVFRSGHPDHVFGTRRTSNHTVGRAVDIWAVDGIPIVTMNAGHPTLRRFLDSARTLGCEEIGGPVDVDGAGGVHFTDHVHRDHVHLGFAEG